MQPGIYAIINSENKKVYIGSTIDLRRRWGAHRSKLCRGVHSNPHLQHAWNKYGEDSFEFKVLEYLDTPKELIPTEQFWMDIYRKEGTALYNCGLAVRNPMLGRKHSKETRDKMSVSRKGRTFSEKHRARLSDARKNRLPPHVKPHPAFIHQETGELIPAGTNLSAICREYNLDFSCLYRVATGERYSHKNWKLMEESWQIPNSQPHYKC